MCSKIQLCHYLLVTLLLVSCSIPFPGETRECDRILEPPLITADLDALDPESIVQWVLDNYQVDPDEVRRYEYVDSEMTKSVSWEVDGTGHSAAFHGARLRSISVNWKSSRPTANEVIDCIGAPDFYGAYWGPAIEGGDYFELELWYPDEGLLVRSFRTDPLFHLLPSLSREQVPEVDGNEVMTELVVVPSGTLTEVLSSTYFPRSARVKKVSLEIVKPWPYEWGDIEITRTVWR